jgi:hypothetical protein
MGRLWTIILGVIVLLWGVLRAMADAEALKNVTNAAIVDPNGALSSVDGSKPSIEISEGIFTKDVTVPSDITTIDAEIYSMANQTRERALLPPRPICNLMFVTTCTGNPANVTYETQTYPEEATVTYQTRTCQGTTSVTQMCTAWGQSSVIATTLELSSSSIVITAWCKNTFFAKQRTLRIQTYREGIEAEMVSRRDNVRAAWYLRQSFDCTQ